MCQMTRSSLCSCRLLDQKQTCSHLLGGIYSIRGRALHLYFELLWKCVSSPTWELPALQMALWKLACISMGQQLICWYIVCDSLWVLGSTHRSTQTSTCTYAPDSYLFLRHTYMLICMHVALDKRVGKCLCICLLYVNVWMYTINV